MSDTKLFHNMASAGKQRKIVVIFKLSVQEMFIIQGTIIISERDGVLSTPAIRPKLGHYDVITPRSGQDIDFQPKPL